MRACLFVVLLLSALGAGAQDLTGIWRGYFQSENGGRMNVPEMVDRYKFEVQLGQDAKSFTGVTYSYKTTVFYGKASAYGSINSQTKKVFLEEMKILEVKTASGGACIMTCFLQYSKVGNEELLEGHYTSMSTQDSTQCGKGTIFLKKVETSDFYKEPFLTQAEKPRPSTTLITPAKPAAPKKTSPPTAKNNTPDRPASPSAATKKANPPMVKNTPSAAAPAKPKSVPQQRPKPSPPTVATPKKTDNLKTIPEDSLRKMIGKTSPTMVVPRVLATRKNELVQTIATSATSVSIKIYDNGTIDNDTVSVYVDKKLVVSKARLTEKAIEVNLKLDGQNETHELAMVAENLGEIPPNTSLMVVTAGDQQYEVRITSTEQKNALVLFKYEPGK